MDMKNHYQDVEDRINESSVNIYKDIKQDEAFDILDESNILDLDNL
jgi:hypothetical protein